MATSLFLLLFTTLWTHSAATCSESTRVRRPWHMLSEHEQLQFVKGFHELRRNGLLILFSMAHQNEAIPYVHHTGQVFFWHSYYLWELENSFRALGPEFECFALPYWDVTNDEAAWSAMDSDTRTASDLPIYNSNLGGEGDLDDNYCVQDALWSVSEYTTDRLCADDEVAPNCCLKRYHSSDDDDSGEGKLPSRSDIAELIFTDKSYALFDTFVEMVNTEHHTHVHQFVASVESHTHLNPHDGEPMEDPLFTLFHSFIEYIRLLRADCYDFDLLAANEIEEAIPYAYGNNTGHWNIDFHMDFSTLCDGSNGEMERMCSHTTITPRMMLDVSPNSIFNVVYELGHLWSENAKLEAECASHLNSTWWRMSGIDETETAQTFLNSAWQRIPPQTISISVLLLMMIAMTAIALLFKLMSATRKGKIVGIHEAAYGAV